MFGIYGNLTKYIELFDNDSFGEWSQTKPSGKNTKIAPHVHYTETARNFIRDVYNFIDDEDFDTVQTSYSNVKKSIDNHDLIIDKATSDEIVYYLLWMVNSERFCDGLLLSYFKDGTIIKCLKKLKDIDDKNIDVYNQRLFKTAINGK